MAITMPNVEVIFKQLATSFIERSQRGIAILIIRDDTNKTFNIKEYASLSAVDEKDYTADNLRAIEDIFNYALNKVFVVRIDTATNTISDALSVIDKNVTTGWITIADGAVADFSAIVSWIKSKELLGKTYKAVVFKVATTDCKHIVNFYNDNVVFKDGRTSKTGAAYLPSLVGILASCNITRGATYFKCNNLKSVTEVANNATALTNGQFILVNDVDTVKIANAINSMTTINGNTATEDMKYIDTVEAMDIITDDITSTFKNEYLGSFRNNYDNQVLLIGSIGAYLKGLAEDDILDNNYANAVDVDVEAQRLAWTGIGKAEAADWTNQQVKNMAFKRTVFLKGDIKILGSMDNLKFNIMLA